jgi:hypothetical protein
VLPHTALTKTDGTVQCPLGVYTGEPVSVSNFRVMFCPVVMTYDNTNITRQGERTITNRQGTPRTETLNRKNNPQRGMRGIHVGLPRHSPGYLVFVPSMGRIYNSTDVYFDEDFNSTLAYESNKFSGYLDMAITEAMPDMDLPTHQTGNPLMFAKNHPPGHIQFAQAYVEEMYDEQANPTDHKRPTPEETSQHAPDDVSETSSECEYEHDIEPIIEEPHNDESPPPLMVRRSERRRNPPDRLIDSAQAATSPTFSWIPEELTSEMQRACHTEVENSIDITNMDPSSLLLAPENWKQVLKLPPHIKRLWILSFVKELKELIKKDTVVHDTPNDDDPIIPVTAKHRVKLNSDGSVEKLKTRIALRGDLMRENVFTPDTWCPIGGFRALKIFLAFAAECRQRIYQLDYVAAFLQADVLGRKFTIFPEGWKELILGLPCDGRKRSKEDPTSLP